MSKLKWKSSREKQLFIKIEISTLYVNFYVRHKKDVPLFQVGKEKYDNPIKKNFKIAVHL